MTRTVVLPEVVYADLAYVSEELTSMARKPISPAMAVSLLIAVYRAHLSEPCARDAFRQQIAGADFMLPEDFEKVWDAPPPKVERRVKRES